MKKRNSENFDFFKDKFDKVKPDTPETLNRDAIKNRILSQENAEIIKIPRKNHFKAIASLAACFVLIFSICIAAYPKMQKPSSDASFNNISEQLLTFSSYDEINSLVKELEKNNVWYSDMYGGTDGTDSLAGGISSPSYSETYKQDEAVDEADVIKTDGKYIYFKHTEKYNKEDKYDYKVCDLIDIYRAENGKTELVSQIDTSDLKCDDDNIVTIEDMFLYKNRLVVNIGMYSYQKNIQITRIYNVSSPKNPKLISDFRQSGSGSTRMIGDILYIVTDCYADSNSPDGDIPKCGFGDDWNYVPVEDIGYFKNSQSPQFIIMSTIDVITGKKTTDTKAILGTSGIIYCNENNLYITSNNYKIHYDETNYTNYINETTVDIIKVELNNDGIRFAASGRVDGHVHNQFSMDEKDGYFRIATTNYDVLDNETSAVYVLDENLNPVGKTDDFAKGESIKAVRYNGDIAHVITFKQIDPLFVIDLSNPEKPIIKGNLEIDGFSSLLVPVSENRLLGIGYQTEETENGTSTCGLKLVLFDISNDENPVALDEKELFGISSEVQYNHQALVVNREKGYYAIPYDEYDFDIGEVDCGVITFEINNDKIEVTNKFRSDIRYQYYDCVRCVYIDDYIYILGEENIDDRGYGDVIVNSYKY